MRAIVRRLSVGMWVYLTCAYGGLFLWDSGHYGRITPRIFAFSVVVGLLSAFGFACLKPWSERVDEGLKRLFSRR